MNLSKPLPAAAVLLSAFSSAASGALSYPTLGGTIAEDFNTGLISANGSTATWTNDSTLPGWSVNYGSSAPSTYYASNGTTARAGEMLSLGLNNNADRALGSSSNGSGSNQHQFSVDIVNTTTIPLTQFTVNYTGEIWRIISDENYDGFIFHYRLGDGPWVAVSSLDWHMNYTSPASNTNVNGNSAGNRSTVGGTVSGINWADGETLTLRWTDYGTAGLHQAQIGIDDFSFSAVPEPSPALLGLSGALAFLVKRRR
jgi:hypothetical protein